MSIELHRTFWPVGHGTFYTEEFCVDDVNKFTAVYDCGGKNISNNIASFLQKEEFSNRNNVEKKTIDLLFISHFHHDHINGVQELITRTKVKRILIPQLSQLMLAESYIYNAIQVCDSEKKTVDKRDITAAQNFIFSLVAHKWSPTQNVMKLDAYKLNIPIIEVVTSESNGRSEGNELIEDTSRFPEKISSGCSITIKLNNVEGQDFTWKYIPVNIGYNEAFAKELIGVIENEINAKIICNEKIAWEELNNALKMDNVMKAVKSKYQTHNTYSMPVFSGPSNYSFDINCNVNLLGESIGLMVEIKNANGKNILSETPLLSCLYMGDFETKEQKKFQELQEVLLESYNAVGLQQVPHHFSKNNHNLDLYIGRLIAFGNVSNQDKSFSTEVAGSILFSGCHPIVIKENKKLHLYYSMKYL